MKASNGGTPVPVIPITRLSLELAFYPSISAGFPSPAEDFEEERLDLNEFLIKNRSSTFFIRVEGISMTGAGIHDDDLLIVDKALEPKSGSIIVAVLEGEFTVKRFIQRGSRYFLKPEHDDYREIEITGNPEFRVWGVVIHVIHSL